MSVIAAYMAEQALRLANERADGFRREAELNRMAGSARRRGARFGAIAAALASLRSTFSSVDVEVPASLPTLMDYPYRG